MNELAKLIQSGWTPKKGQQSAMDNLQAASDVGYRGLLANLLGSPIDTANLAQNAGRDAILGYSKGKSGNFLSELFDVREMNYPDKYGTSTDIWEDFY